MNSPTSYKEMYISTNVDIYQWNLLKDIQSRLNTQKENLKTEISQNTGQSWSGSTTKELLTSQGIEWLQKIFSDLTLITSDIKDSISISVV